VVSLSIGHILPLSNENRWTDLFAVLIEADPVSASAAFDLGGDQAQRIGVRRESRGIGRDRLDLLITAGGHPRAVIEVKVLAGLGREQLLKYRKAFPDVERHILIFPERLPIRLAQGAGWEAVTWERVLDAFRRSPRSWVAETATAWVNHLDKAIPHVDAQTRWNDLRDGEDLVVAMRARMSWVYGALDPPSPIEHDLVESSAGGSWVARMNLPTRVAGYWIRVEAEENLRGHPKRASASGRALRGPSIKVCLVQTNVSTSASFDWTYLLSLWPLMAAARSDWVTAQPRPRSAHDRQGWLEMVAQGGPRYLGIGFGEAQARRRRECMFGARVQLQADIRLDALADALEDTANLMVELAGASAPQPARLTPSPDEA
jgi:hypothetical protein